ncbi:MAG: hypothetical protein QNJ68_16815 [Microcoleaceae cyanobacterium MO_207.B10]|nr:hypothetical protein [Microcoleaceae cyanobacterium MO_207.B10]
MNFVKTNKEFLKLGLLSLGAFLLSTYSVKVLASTSEVEIEQNSMLLAESSRNSMRVCSQKGANWSEINYFESKNYFANICRQPSGNLMLIAGKKSNPNEVLELPVEFNEGYFAVDGNRTFIVDDGSFSMAINGLVVKKEQIIYQGQSN